MRIIERGEVDSTFLEAVRLIESGLDTPSVVCAIAQTGGYGRFGRSWYSPPGNLYWTAILFPDDHWPKDLGLTFAAGLAVADTLRNLGAEFGRVSLKWPNDCLLDGKKISGVLLQTGEEATRRRSYVLVGIGLNVESTPASTFYPAISLAQSGVPATVKSARDGLTESFSRRFSQWKAGGFDAFYSDYVQLLDGVGSKVKVSSDRNRKVVTLGTNRGVDRSGALLLELENGTLRHVYAGDLLSEA